jgi:hypothetical protein
MTVAATPPGPAPQAPPPATRHAASAATWADGLLAGVAGALVLGLGFETADRLTRGDGATPALLGTVALHGPLASTATPVVAAREVAAGLGLLVLVACVIGLALAWWVTRLRRFPSTGSAWLASFMGLAIGLAVLDRTSGAELLRRLGPWSLLGAMTAAAVAMPLVLWKRQPRLVQNRRDLRDDEP